MSDMNRNFAYARVSHAAMFMAGYLGRVRDGSIPASLQALRMTQSTWDLLVGSGFWFGGDRRSMRSALESIHGCSARLSGSVGLAPTAEEAASLIALFVGACNQRLAAIEWSGSLVSAEDHIAKGFVESTNSVSPVTPSRVWHLVQLAPTLDGDPVKQARDAWNLRATKSLAIPTPESFP